LISIVWEPYTIISCACYVSYYVPQGLGLGLGLGLGFLIKSPNEVWRLIVFAPFLLIIIILLPLLLAAILSDQILGD
jgi:hypothetical protein